VLFCSVSGAFPSTQSAPADFVVSQQPSETPKMLVERIFGKDSPMLQVARCESGLRQYQPGGALLRGRVNPSDVGIFQINEHYHQSAALALGLDIEKPEDNVRYAYHLYQQNGFQDWKASKSCWGENSSSTDII
jgi:hypothetical protein